jgi:hypothetical protein
MAKQTQVLITAALNGFSGTIEKVTAAEVKRRNASFAVVPGDGLSQAEQVHDPVAVPTEITLSVAVDREKAFIEQAQALFVLHKRSPESAGSLTIRSHAPDGSIVATAVLMRAVIQAVRFTPGDTASHTEAMSEIVVQPHDISGSLAAFATAA